jgi:PPOX class probable F420-dependent enzyme
VTEQTARPTTIGGLLIRRLTALDEEACRLLREPNVCTVCTFAPDGSIHAHPVWVDTDGEHVLLNSVGGRAWVRNLQRSGRVTCTVVNLANPYEFVEIRGRADDPTREGADEHIHFLAKKYLGADEYPWMDPRQPRLLFRVHPERVVHMHPGDPELEGS